MAYVDTINDDNKNIILEREISIDFVLLFKLFTVFSNAIK